MPLFVRSCYLCSILKDLFLVCCVCPPTQEGDYPAATQLCLECQNAIETYKHFTCVK